MMAPNSGGSSQNPYVAPAILPQPQGPTPLAAQPQPITLRIFDASDALSRAWKIYMDNIGNCLLASLCMFGIIAAVGVYLLLA